MRRLRRGEDTGFTLVETLIAMVVMSVAVSAIVTALAGLTNATRFHRGHATVETAARSYAQAVEARALFRTTLTQPLTKSTSATSVDVADASAFTPGPAAYVNIGQEAMRVQAVDLVNNRLTVVRAPHDPAALSAHAVGAAVVPLLRCPSASELRPPAGTWTVPVGVTPTVSGISYWDSDADDWQPSQNDCRAEYDATCLYPGPSGSSPDVRMECGDGIFRVDISVASSDEYQSIDTTTSVIVRRGSI